MSRRFNFDQCIDRTTTESEKWGKYAGKDIIPLWVADTDFAAPPAVTAALQQRVAHSIFGYGEDPQSLREAFADHVDHYFDWQIDPEWIVFLPGLVCGLNLVTLSLCGEGHTVIYPEPVYPPFQAAPKNQSRAAVSVPMQCVDGRWVLDMTAFEEAAKAHPGGLFLLCNPHNPGGTVYQRAELEAISVIAERYDLTVCADEIHADLLLEPGLRHIPYASLNEQAAHHSVVLMAPSKTYNLAGLGCSLAIVPDAKLRKQLQRRLQGLIPHVNILGFVAAEAAYRYGREWLAEQLDYLRANRDRLVATVNELPGLEMASPEATYLGWIDCRGLGLANPSQFFEEHGLGMSPGLPFGDAQFVRFNFGCTEATMTEALQRMRNAVASL